MKKIPADQLPKAFGERTRPVSGMSLEALKTTGQSFVSYGISKDETIEFPDNKDEIQVFEQKINPNRDATQRLLVVMRNGKPSYLSLGVLNRTDAQRVPTCDFCAEMAKYDNDYERVIALCGKKITCHETKNALFQKFDRATGNRIEGETVSRPTPVIEYA